MKSEGSGLHALLDAALVLTEPVSILKSNFLEDAIPSICLFAKAHSDVSITNALSASENRSSFQETMDPRAMWGGYEWSVHARVEASLINVLCQPWTQLPVAKRHVARGAFLFRALSPLSNERQLYREEGTALTRPV